MNKNQQIKDCFKTISDFCLLHKLDDSTKKLLDTFLSNYLQIRRAPTSIEMQFKLEQLINASGFDGSKDTKLLRDVITRSIEHGWASFYPIRQTYNKSIDNIPTVSNRPRPKRIELSNEEF